MLQTPSPKVHIQNHVQTSIIRRVNRHSFGKTQRRHSPLKTPLPSSLASSPPARSPTASRPPSRPPSTQIRALSQFSRHCPPRRHSPSLLPPPGNLRRTHRQHHQRRSPPHPLRRPTKPQPQPYRPHRSQRRPREVGPKPIVPRARPGIRSVLRPGPRQRVPAPSPKVLASPSFAPPRRRSHAPIGSDGARVQERHLLRRSIDIRRSMQLRNECEGERKRDRLAC